MISQFLEMQEILKLEKNKRSSKHVNMHAK